MPRSRAEIKAEIEAEATRLIDALLDWTDQAEAPTLTEIEDEVLKLRQQFAEKLAAAAVDRQASTEPLTVTVVRWAAWRPVDGGVGGKLGLNSLSTVTESGFHCLPAEPARYSLAIAEVV